MPCRVKFSLQIHTVTVELQWLEHFGTMKICSRHWKLELMSVNHSARSGGIIEISSRFSLT